MWMENEDQSPLLHSSPDKSAWHGREDRIGDEYPKGRVGDDAWELSCMCCPCFSSFWPF